MLARVFALTLALLLVSPATPLSATESRAVDVVPTVRHLETVDDTVPENTVNEFLPEDRGLGECISAVPKPGCGSKARGGWRQGLVFLVIVAGLGVIAWRVVASSRRARRERDELSSTRAPDATSARAEPGGDPGP